MRKILCILCVGVVLFSGIIWVVPAYASTADDNNSRKVHDLETMSNSTFSTLVLVGLGVLVGIILMKARKHGKSGPGLLAVFRLMRYRKTM